MRRSALLCLPLLVAGAAFGQGIPIGDKLDQLSLVSTKDNSAVAVPLAAGKPTVVLFVSTQCPVSNAYHDRMSALYRDYQGKGVSFVFINSNATESAQDILAHSARNSLAYVTHKDPGNRWADRLGATVTPEAYVFTKDGTLAYHGAIDDSREPARVTVTSLKAALDSVITGQPVTEPERKAMGCTIKRVRKGS